MKNHLFFCSILLFTLRIFVESEGKCFAILNRKNHSQYGQIHATLKNSFKIIVFCKAQHNT